MGIPWKHTATAKHIWLAALVLVVGYATFGIPRAAAQGDKDAHWSAREKPLADRIDGLRGLPDDVRADATKKLAVQIRRLPATANKLRLATYLAGLSTEGDFGHGTLQQVATTLAATLRQRPMPWTDPGDSDSGKFETALIPVYAYRALAQLVRYENVAVALNGDEHYRAAIAQLEVEDRRREHPDFALKDLAGKSWRLSELRGKVVMINFWATWCPPCRKELPDLEALYGRFAAQGLMVIAISDEPAIKVEPFVRKHALSFPVLLDPARTVNDLFGVKGIPKTYIYDRAGNLAAQAIDMRTQAQFLALLRKAGLEVTR